MWVDDTRMRLCAERFQAKNRALELEPHVNNGNAWYRFDGFGVAGAWMGKSIAGAGRGLAKVRSAQADPVSVRRQHGVDATEWRDGRLDAMRALSSRVTTLRWSPTLFRMLIEELFIEEDFARVCGSPRKLPLRRYPQGVLIALALRHSWREDDLKRFMQRIGVHASPSRRSRRLR